MNNVVMLMNKTATERVFLIALLNGRICLGRVFTITVLNTVCTVSNQSTTAVYTLSIVINTIVIGEKRKFYCCCCCLIVSPQQHKSVGSICRGCRKSNYFIAHTQDH